MDKRIWWCAGILVVILLLASILQSIQKPEPAAGEPIKIGADFAMTGNTAQYGTWIVNGANLAIREVNESGGVNDRPLELIVEDNQGQVARAVLAYEKLTDSDGARYMLTFVSSIALAIAPLANEDKVIQMDIVATTPKYSSPNDFTFRTSVVANQLAGDAAATLSARPDVKNVAVLYINNDFGLGMLEAFRSAYKGNVVAVEAFPQDGSDFRTQLAKIKEANPDTVFLVSHLKEGGLMVRQAREIGISAKIFSDIYSIEGPDFLRGAGDAAEGVEYLAPKFDPGSKESMVRRFTESYRQAYNEEPVLIAAQAYDAVYALAKAMEGCVYGDTECVRKNLVTIEFDGASGVIKFDVNGDVTKEVELKTVKNGEFVKLEY